MQADLKRGEIDSAGIAEMIGLPRAYARAILRGKHAPKPVRKDGVFVVFNRRAVRDFFAARVDHRLREHRGKRRPAKTARK